jgi:hypothetical protein
MFEIEYHLKENNTSIDEKLLFLLTYNQNVISASLLNKGLLHSSTHWNNCSWFRGYVALNNPLVPTIMVRACLTDPLKGPNPYNNRRNKGLGATRPSSRPRKTSPRIDFLQFWLRGGSSPLTCTGREAEYRANPSSHFTMAHGHFRISNRFPRAAAIATHAPPLKTEYFVGFCFTGWGYGVC